jgi:hypothetical protein
MRRRWRIVGNKQFGKAIVSRACHPEKVSISVLMWFGLGLTLVALYLPPYAVAQESVEAAPGGEAILNSGETTSIAQTTYKEPTKNLFTLALGWALWPSLGNKDFGTSGSTESGHVSSSGLAFEAAYHRHIAHWRHSDLYLGPEFGAFIFNNENSDNPTQPSTGQPIQGALDARVFYAGPGIKFMTGEGRLKYFLGAGGGYYHVDLTESDEVPRPPCTNFGPCFQTNRSLNKGTIGGYVSLGVDLIAFDTQTGWNWRVRLEDKIHLVNFGSLDSFSPGAGNLSGPINAIQVGVVAGF